MKKIILVSIFLVSLGTVYGQISILADSMVVCKTNSLQDKYYPISKVAESLSIEIDKDLMTLRVYGTNHEHAVIEMAYILDLSNVDTEMQKWLFQAQDKNCNLFTITLNVPEKRIDFITIRKDISDNKSLMMIYYPITDIKINKEAIIKHLLEKTPGSKF